MLVELKKKIIQIFIKKKNINFLLVGGFNTIFGYLCSLVLYYYLNIYLNIIIIGIIINFVNISFSFFTYKIFVFKNLQQNWITQYLKSFMTYGFIILVNISLMALMVEFLSIKFWIVATILTIASPLLLYLLHKNFTFSEKFFKKKNFN